MQTQSKQLDFSGHNFYCGIDVHKKCWTVTIQTDELKLKTFSQDPDPGQIVKYLKKNYPGGNFLAGYEAGYFGYGIQRTLESMGVSCVVLHPADIPTSDKDREQKRDPRDSRKIANAIKNHEVASIWVPPLDLEQDRQLLRIREKLSKDKTRIKNRIKAFLQLHGISYPESFSQPASHWSGRFIKWLDTIELRESTGTEALRSMVRCLRFQRSEILLVSRKIKQLSQSEKYKQQYSRLIKKPGIGMIMAMTILTEAGDICRFKTVDNFRSFMGIVPRAHDSGDKERPGKITKRANAYLRYLLVEVTWMAIRYNPYYLNIYKDYRKRMKENKALIRTAVKLTNEIYYCLKNEV
jgi:transposase